MSEMIERVAKAVEASISDMIDANDYHLNKQDYEKMARAALAAMREPTEAMVLVCSVTGPTREVVERQKEAVRRDYRTMIDAALTPDAQPGTSQSS